MKRFVIIAALTLSMVSAFAEEIYNVCLPVAVSVYENAVTDAKIIGTLSPKQAVEVYVVNGDWAIIKYNGGVGYVAAACLKKAEPAAATDVAAETQQPVAQQPAEPAQQQPVSVQQQPQPKKPEPKPVEPEPTTTLTTKGMQLPKTNFFEPYKPYRMTSSSNRVADVLYCKGQMYLTFDYQMVRLNDPLLTFAKNNQYEMNIHMGAFNFGGIARLWGPIGLDMGFGLSVGGSNYDVPQDGYERTTRFKMDYNLYLRPVFWLNITDDIALHLVTGPRFDLVFLETDDSYGSNGKSDFGKHVAYAHLEKEQPYRFLQIPWGLGLGFNYKHIGFRVLYEWELFGGYKDKWLADNGIDRTIADARHNTLSVQVYIPIMFF